MIEMFWPGEPIPPIVGKSIDWSVQGASNKRIVTPSLAYVTHRQPTRQTRQTQYSGLAFYLCARKEPPDLIVRPTWPN
jgi:hypothetical protein